MCDKKNLAKDGKKLNMALYANVCILYFYSRNVSAVQRFHTSFTVDAVNFGGHSAAGAREEDDVRGGRPHPRRHRGRWRRRPIEHVATASNARAAASCSIKRRDIRLTRRVHTANGPRKQGARYNDINDNNNR